MFLSLILLAIAQAQHAPTSAATVPQCRAVTLKASYLAEETPTQGPGFLFTLRNERDQPIAVVDPMPLSVHWYALSAGWWLWRASSGAGGSLVNALRPDGPLFASGFPSTALPVQTRTIAPHASYQWTSFESQVPALHYRPTCEHCSYAGETRFRAVLAYAYAPGPNDKSPDLLRCGLRSEPVAMPPFDPRKKKDNPAR